MLDTTPLTNLLSTFQGTGAYSNLVIVYDTSGLRTSFIQCTLCKFNITEELYEFGISNTKHSECITCGECLTICKHEMCTRCWSVSCMCTFCLTCQGRTHTCECNLSETEVSATVWDLPQHLRLSELAADFYTLYSMSLDEEDHGLFADFLSNWTPIFARYTDMIIGGELRHMRNKGSQTTPLEKALEKDYWHGGLLSKRSRAWLQWFTMRQQYGSEILVEASEIFRERGSSSYGGDAWARISDILYRYETGVFSPTLFLDAIWGLRHNTSTYFSKMPWNDKQLRSVLDSNLYERGESITENMSAVVRNFRVLASNGFGQLQSVTDACRLHWSQQLDGEETCDV